MKKFIFLTLILFSVFLLGCGIGSFGSSSSMKDIDIYVGNEGLTAEFAANAPPQTIFENSNFPIFIRVRNLGAYDIKQDNGIISVGVEKDYIKELKKEAGIFNQQEPNILTFGLNGKSRINSNGDELYASLSAKTGQLDPQSEIHPSTITATFCYPYKTILSTTICIDPDFAGIRPGKKVCKIQDMSFSGQGAPIAVTRIEPQMVSEGDKVKPQFLIYLENKGNGNPVRIDGYPDACIGKVSANEKVWNAAYVKAYSSQGQDQNQLECTPTLKDSGISEDAKTDDKTGFVRFRDRKDYIKCIFKEGFSRDVDAYTSPLRIEISYGYVQSIAANFNIKKPLKY